MRCYAGVSLLKSMSIFNNSSVHISPSSNPAQGGIPFFGDEVQFELIRGIQLLIRPTYQKSKTTMPIKKNSTMNAAT